VCTKGYYLKGVSCRSCTDTDISGSAMAVLAAFFTTAVCAFALLRALRCYRRRVKARLHVARRRLHADRHRSFAALTDRLRHSSVMDKAYAKLLYSVHVEEQLRAHMLKATHRMMPVKVLQNAGMQRKRRVAQILS